MTQTQPTQGTTAIAYNVTATDTQGAGYLQIAPGDATGLTSTSINWTATGQTIAGPAIIEERETTTALPPGWSATIDALGCIVATKG